MKCEILTNDSGDLIGPTPEGAKVTRILTALQEPAEKVTTTVTNITLTTLNC